MFDDRLVAGLFFLFTVALVCGGAVRIVWVVLYDEYIGVAEPRVDRAPSGFDVLVNRGPIAHGRYRVSGVMPSVGADVTMRLEADSPDGARVKAESGGVVVTDVAWEG
jgi:hypothetical protein